MNRALISDALGQIREEHITAALCRVDDDRTKPAAKIRRAAALALAAALLLALAVTAAATGLFSSLFARIGELWAVPDPERYERAGELSQKEPERVDLRALPGNVFTLSESFYDGEELLLAYSLESLRYPVSFGFGPGDEGFESLTTTGPWYISAQWEQELSPEDYQEICRLLREEDSAGFVIRTAYLGDHIRLDDGTDLGPMLSHRTPEGAVILEPQEGLPESARGREELALVFTLREALAYYYKADGLLYQYHAPLREETVTIAIPNIG